MSFGFLYVFLFVFPNQSKGSPHKSFVGLSFQLWILFFFDFLLYIQPLIQKFTYFLCRFYWLWSKKKFMHITSYIAPMHFIALGSTVKTIINCLIYLYDIWLHCIHTIRTLDSIQLILFFSFFSYFGRTHIYFRIRKSEQAFKELLSSNQGAFNELSFFPL